jgi:hypothetical protein
MRTVEDVDSVADQIRQQTTCAFEWFANDTEYTLRVTLKDNSHIQVADRKMTGCLQKMIDAINARKEGW